MRIAQRIARDPNNAQATSLAPVSRAGAAGTAAWAVGRGYVLALHEIDHDQAGILLDVADLDALAITLAQLLKERQRIMIVGEAHGLAGRQGVEGAKDRRVPKPLGDASRVEGIDGIGGQVKMWSM